MEDPPPNNLKQCFCDLCGGPAGKGKAKPYSTYQRHQAQQRERNAQANSAVSQSSHPSSFHGQMDMDEDDEDEDEDEADKEEDTEEEGEEGQQPWDKTRENLQMEVDESEPGHGAAQDEDMDEVPPDIPTNYNDQGGMSIDSRSQSPRSNHTQAGSPKRPASVISLPDSDSDEEPPAQTDLPEFVSKIDDIRLANEFIAALKNASLENDIEPLDAEVIHQIRNPPTEQLKIDNPSDRMSLDIYLAIDNASEETYKAVCDAIHRRFPAEKPLSYYRVKRLVERMTGIVPIMRDMCVNSCCAYTGPDFYTDTCADCKEPRWEQRDGDEKVPRMQWMTFPLAPQLQALHGSPEGAESLGYRSKYTDKIIAELTANNGRRKSPYRDFFDGKDFLDRVIDEKIASGDMVLILSTDGAQLYRNKTSDCWIYIWIILDHAPDVRYRKRHILPGAIIPGKPKHLDSFMFPGLHHLAAIQKEGLAIWDASTKTVFESKPLLALATADGPGMACMNGLVGHQGKVHCRLQCPLKGRHKHGASQYYPVRQKPNNYTVAGCDHPDVDLTDLLQNFTTEESLERYHENLSQVEHSSNPTEFKRRRLQTGICKPSIFSGLPKDRVLPPPTCFPLDIMHLAALNIPDLFLPLWRGTFDCDKTDNKNTWDWAVLTGEVWTTHGKMVEDAKPFLPGSFDRPPRNPAEKISSGYKAWEYLLYFYGLGPCLFFKILPDVYWRHYCKLVRAFRIMMQEEISVEELAEAHEKFTEFSDEFEELYCQRRADRIHFVRPSLHTPSHLCAETERIGPPSIYSQWAMERTIGNLGEEIRLHSNAFANLAQRGLRRCQVNALKTMIPDLAEPIKKPLSHTAVDLGESYALLSATDDAARPSKPLEQAAFLAWAKSAFPLDDPLADEGDIENHNKSLAALFKRVVRWARVRLPNGQEARTRWKEFEQTERKGIQSVRSSRNIKFESASGMQEFAEVLYFALVEFGGKKEAIAVISVYGQPDHELLEDSSHTYYTVQHRGEAGIRVISAKSIKSVVAAVPDSQYAKYKQDGSQLNRWHIFEKPGLKLCERAPISDDSDEESGGE